MTSPEPAGKSTPQSDLPIGTSGRDALTVATQLARQAARLARGRLDAEHQVHYKGKADLVTEVDLGAQQLIVEGISREFPGHDILAEESAARKRSSPYVWIIDPIDGTLNYARDIAFFCISVALARHDDTICGVIVDPMRDEVFFTQRGCGSYLNGKPISVGSNHTLGHSTVGIDLGYDEEGRRRALRDAGQLLPYIQTLRLLGSSALGLAYVACGRLDAYLHHWLFPWDLATARLLVAEAGGQVTERDGSSCSLSSHTVLAANAELHGLLLAALR